MLTITKVITVTTKIKMEIPKIKKTKKLIITIIEK